jgi:putative transposase
MIALEDRRSLAHDIDTAHKAGARLRLACSVAGIDARTLASAAEPSRAS